MKTFFQFWKNDLPSSVVVFLVALPLCLGIGLASTNVENIDGLPNLFSGIIAGVIGGIVVGALSGSRLGVSGPAAGLITIVIAAITTLGSYQGFLLAVFISGIIQLIAGFLKAGVIGNYFPSSVIKGMLAAIGITLILKEIPHAFGYDKDFIGDEAFLQPDGHNTFSEFVYMLNGIGGSALIISVSSIAILILFEQSFMKRFRVFQLLPGALFVVVFGIVMNEVLTAINPSYQIAGEHLVSIPVLASFSEIGNLLTHPDFSYLTNPDVYIVALTLALVGSLETLLSVEATDRLDPDKHTTPTNRELKAQGVGNMVSGLIGGLPITQVIVRSSANINSGAKSKLSAIVHGLLLIGTVLFIPKVLNMIPYASLAAILIMIGYKLAKISLFKQLYKAGLDQFIPFVATIVGVLFTDLLKGIFIGIAFAIFYVLKKNYKNNYRTVIEEHEERKAIKIILSEEVSFLNKASLKDLFENLDEKEQVILDGRNCKNMDYDALEIIRDFKHFGAKEKEIDLKIIGLPQLKN